MISGTKSIDSDFYDNSGYHEINASHLRISKVVFKSIELRRLGIFMTPNRLTSLSILDVAGVHFAGLLQEG